MARFYSQLKKEHERRQAKYDQMLKSYNAQVEKARKKGSQATAKFQDDMRKCWVRSLRVYLLALADLCAGCSVPSGGKTDIVNR